MAQKKIGIAKATLINGGAKYINVFFMIIANAILSRLLSPDDYGKVAIITVFVTFFMTFSDIGLGAGVVQNKELTDEDITSIFSFSFYLSAIIAIIFVFASYPIAWFYQEYEYVKIGRLLAISLFFNAFSMIPNACLMKEKRFLLTGVRTIVAYVISYLSAIVLAYNGAKYYSLVWQAIIYAVITFFWNIAITKLHFRLKFKYSSVSKILSYSSYNFGFDFLEYFVRNMDSFLTGKFMGSAMLGYYNKAYSLMLYPVVYLTNVIATVLHPILSDYQNDKEYIWRKFISVFKILSLIGTFISIFFFFGAKEIIYILYGEKWGLSIPCVQMLSISVWFQMTSTSYDGIYRSLGKTKLLFNTATIFVPVQLICIIIGCLSKNLIILSGAVTLAYILKFLITTNSLVKKGFGKSQFHIYKILWPELCTTAVTIIICLFARNIQIDNVFLSGVFKFFVCFVCVIIGYLVTGEIDLKERRVNIDRHY